LYLRLVTLALETLIAVGEVVELARLVGARPVAGLEVALPLVIEELCLRLLLRVTLRLRLLAAETVVAE